MTAGGLDGKAIRNVRILERFALVEVPAGAEPETVRSAVAKSPSSPFATRRRPNYVHRHDEHHPR